MFYVFKYTCFIPLVLALSLLEDRILQFIRLHIFITMIFKGCILLNNIGSYKITNINGVEIITFLEISQHQTAHRGPDVFLYSNKDLSFYCLDIFVNCEFKRECLTRAKSQN